MAEMLTAEQKMVVENRGGRLLVSAAAGSGKTKVLVDRLLRYMMDEAHPCNIDDFLIITYTKAAASELRGKIAAKLSQRLAEDPENVHLQRQMQRLYLAHISTVHGFCTELLRQYAYEVELPGDFRVADEKECDQLRQQAMEQVLEQAYATMEAHPEFRVFVDTQGLGRDDRLVPQLVQQVYDSARCHLNPAHWLDHCLESAGVRALQDGAETIWGAFLLEDLRYYTRLQLRAVEQAVELAAQEEGLEKVQALLEQTKRQLEALAQSRTWEEAHERSQLDYGSLRFPTKAKDTEAAQRIKAIRNGCKEGMTKRLEAFCEPTERILEDLGQTQTAVEGLIGLTRAFDRAYSQLKLRRRVLDFSDLEHRTLDLLRGRDRGTPTAMAREIGNRYREVLVDEYQDSNAVQDSIFSALTDQRQNCFMVGDVKQSIYRFRLADPGIFLEKYSSYLPAEEAGPGEDRKILLSKNFRSGGAILEATNDVFYRCMCKAVGGLDYTEAEALREGIPHISLNEPEVELHLVRTGENAYAQEAAFVADRILELLNGGHMIRAGEGLRPIEPEDIAILLRSPGSVGREFQEALSMRGIRSSMGTSRDLLQTGEISVLRSLLQVISNPRQEIPLAAVLASPLFGFSADELARIRAKTPYVDFYQALCADEGEKSRAFVEDLTALRREAKLLPLAELLEQIFCRTRMDSIYAAMETGVECTENLREFYGLAMDFEATAWRDLGQFLEYLDMLEESGLKREETAAGGCVSILSIHKSKGLEYPVVFLSGLSRSFNREDLRAPVLCEGELGLGLSASDQQTRVRYPTVARRAIQAKTMQENLSEEMRVLYVAMTRARDRLIMTYAAKTPEKELTMLASRMGPDSKELLAGEVSCPGEWVLMEALCRREAGALFELADGCRPPQTQLHDHPWLIRVHEAPQPGTVGEGAVEPLSRLDLPTDTEERLGRHLRFHYAHEAATHMPSKQTATQIKGRPKDEEIQENTRKKPVHREFRRLAQSAANRGAAYGTAMHTLMQYISMEHCGTLEGVEGEISRLTQRRILTPEQAEKADRRGVLAFFQSELGEKIRRGKILREFKFSILDDAAGYGPGLEGEQVLLQGVVDCALLEPEGITVVDFKTDYVTADTLEELTERYRPQIQLYANQMERICEQPVLRKYLYFFHLRRLVELA